MAKSTQDARGKDSEGKLNAEEQPVARKARPMNRRRSNDEMEEGEIVEIFSISSNSGGTRSPKVLQKNRKRRAA